MAGKLNRRSQQRLKRMLESIDNINKFATRIRVEDIEELVRRDATTIDTYGNTAGSSFAVARTGGKPNSSSVERAVIAKVEGKPIKDPVREEVKRIEKWIVQTEENLRQVHQSIKFLKEGVEKQRKRPSSEPCEICMVLPAVKTAMCPTCYSEWVDVGAPDRFRWRAYKRAITSSEGIPLVVEQPPARRTNLNT